jgi:hypothetical protein
VLALIERRARGAVATVAAIAAVCGAGAAAAQASAELPDGRAYELVSPPEKRGGDIMADSANTHVAVDGSAAVFTSLTGFGGVEGMGGNEQYLSQRDPGAGKNGWATHAITPRNDALALQLLLNGQPPGFEAAFTPDLAYGVYRTRTQLTDAPNVAEMGKLYLRGDLRTGAATNLLLSDSASPVPLAPYERPVLAGASSDLSHVIFESRAALTLEASPGMNLYESVNGNLRLAGVLPDGTPAAASATGLFTFSGTYPDNMISADGSRVFFMDFTGRIYMRVNGTTTVQLNASEKTSAEGEQPATLFAASADGMRAFFVTGEGLLDGDDEGAADLYMYDSSQPAGRRLSLLSGDGEPADTHYAQGVIGTSADGHYVYFVSDGQLVSGEPLLNNAQGIYLWHDGVVRYIGAVADPPEIIMNGPQAQVGFPAVSRTGRVTPDGRHLLFVTRSDAGFRGRGGFAGYDHGSTCTFDTSAGGPCREVYVYSADTGGLACASCDPRRNRGIADALVNTRVATGVTAENWHLSHALSDDGRYVFFNTAQPLVPEDVNGKVDAYQYDVVAKMVHLLSSGRSTADSFFLDGSPTGRDVFFVTRERLVGWDTDDSYDLYDARVGGGFPEPVVPPGACSGEGCRGPGSVAPVPGAAGSSGFRGAGDLPGALRHRRADKSQRRCKRSVHRHGKRPAAKRRCIRRHARRHARRTVDADSRRSK